MRKNRAKKSSHLIITLIGTSICMLLMLCSVMLMGTLMIKEIIDESSAIILNRILLFASVIIGITITQFIGNIPAATFSMVICGTLILMQLLLCAFTYDGIGVKPLINSLIIALGGGGSVAIKLKIKKKTRHSKKAFC